MAGRISWSGMGYFHFCSSFSVLMSVYSKENFDLKNLKFQLKKNKEMVQDGNTNLMLFSPDQIIVFVSQYFTLRVGDLIYTGTPKGVGKVEENDELELFLLCDKVLSLRIQ